MWSHPSKPTGPITHHRPPRITVRRLFHKRADREIAALQFLTSIPMVNERARLERLQQEQLQLQLHLEHYHQQQQRQSGGLGLHCDVELAMGVEDEDDDESMMLLDSPMAAAASSRAAYPGQPPSVPGKQLEGPAPALVVAVPSLYRHRYLRSTAVMTQWEEGLVRRDGLLDGRLFFASGRNYPLAVASVIGYRPGAEEDKRLRCVDPLSLYSNDRLLRWRWSW